MAWTTPQTWTAALVTVADFNEQIRDNLDWLKSRPLASFEGDGSGNYTVTATSDTKISTDFDLTITTTASCKVLALFVCRVVHSNTGTPTLSIYVDGASAAPTGMVHAYWNGTDQVLITAMAIIDISSAGSHTFSLYSKAASGTSTFFNNSGAISASISPTFIVMEIA